MDSEFEKGRRVEKFIYVVSKPACNLQAYSIRRASDGPDVARARAVIAEFHRQFNEGRYPEMYAATSATFKAAGTEAEFTTLMDNIKSKLGRHKTPTQTLSALDTVDGRSIVDLTVQSEFEKGKVEEVFMFVVTKSSCLLDSYQINETK